MVHNSTLNDQIDQCQGLVRFLAQQIHSRIPSSVEMDDLIGYGQVGLMQAARDFDHTRGTKFSTFAYYRIRGAIFDGINKLMWFKSVRDPETKYVQMADSYLHSLSNETSETEKKSSNELSHEANWFARTVGALAVSYLASSDDVDRSKDLVDKSSRAPWSDLVHEETHCQLAAAIDQLEPQSAALIRAVYYEDQTLQATANQLKISKSWASRTHARALEQIARYLKKANFASDCSEEGQVD